MGKYIKIFNNHSEYEAFKASEDYITPNVSLCVDENEVHYNPYVEPPFFCKLTLNNGSTVELEGSGVLTYDMVGKTYSTTILSAEIGTQCTSIGSGAFSNCTSLTSIDIPSGVTSIGEGAFNNCSSLTSIVIPSGVTSIGDGAFERCSGLTSCTIGSGVTTIGSGAFNGCSGLTSVIIGNSVETIGDNAFSHCTSLTSIDIPSGVTSIGGGAFDSCSSLSTITSYIMNAPSVNPGTFAYVSNGGTLYVQIGSSGYDTWMNDQGNLGLYGWTKAER